MFLSKTPNLNRIYFQVSSKTLPAAEWLSLKDWLEVNFRIIAAVIAIINMKRVITTRKRNKGQLTNIRIGL